MSVCMASQVARREHYEAKYPAFAALPAFERGLLFLRESMRRSAVDPEARCEARVFVTRYRTEAGAFLRPGEPTLCKVTTWPESHAADAMAGRGAGLRRLLALRAVLRERLAADDPNLVRVYVSNSRVPSVTAASAATVMFLYGMGHRIKPDLWSDPQFADWDARLLDDLRYTHRIPPWLEWEAREAGSKGALDRLAALEAEAPPCPLFRPDAP